MERRTFGAEFRAAEGDSPIIEGYFSVFDKPYYCCQGGYETVAKGAFDNALDDDIRALINHDTRLVLGRTKAGTLTLTQDDKGLFGRIDINPNDGDAMNLYARVQRGDVSQCSFGFDILDEETELLDNDTVHFTIKSVKLYEVSVCTFPAYEDTEVKARSIEVDTMRKEREAEAWRVQWRNKLKGAE